MAKPVKEEIIFTISARDAEKVHKWQRQHPCKIRGQYQGAIGGAFTFSFTNTGVGQVQTIKCSCGAKLDFSHYDEW